MRCVIVTEKFWNKHIVEDLSRKLNIEFQLISKEESLVFDKLVEISPNYIFFPHWSHIIPSSIYKNFECVVFHMTDLPFGRGGSPLQNLIERGITHTKISALKVVNELDAGPIYLKRDLCLLGTAEEIFIRASKVISEMIEFIVTYNPKPQMQAGEIVSFTRRKPGQSDISQLDTIEQVFDYIRMLDAEGYPKAFLETDNFRLEFSRASLKVDSIMADVKIVLKKRRADVK